MELTLVLLESLMSKKLGYLFNFHDLGDGYWMVDTQDFFPDGDPYLVYIMGNDKGNFLITDRGHTLLHLSYESENMPSIANLNTDLPLEIKEREFVLESSASTLEANLVRFCSGITAWIDSQRVSPLMGT